MDHDNIAIAGIQRTAHQLYTSQTGTTAVPSPGQSDTQGSQPGQPSVAASGDQVQIRHTTATKNLETSRAIELMQSRLNELATGVRASNEGLTKASEQIGKMQNTLQGVTKMYPPYATDSEARQAIMMSYISLRKEIESLMVPKPPVPIYEKNKHMWDSLFAENGQIQPQAVPKLDASSTDKQIKDATVTLDKTGQQLVSSSTDITNSLLSR